MGFHDGVNPGVVYDLFGEDVTSFEGYAFRQ